VAGLGSKLFCIPDYGARLCATDIGLSTTSIYRSNSFLLCRAERALSKDDHSWSA